MKATFDKLFVMLIAYHQSKTLIFSSMALQPLWALAAFSVSLSYTQSVGLLGRGSARSKAATYTQNQHKRRLNGHRHPFLEWDLNPQSQRSSERRQFMP
jgi:hypothetical protein